VIFRKFCRAQCGARSAASAHRVEASESLLQPNFRPFLIPSPFVSPNTLSSFSVRLLSPNQAFWPSPEPATKHAQGRCGYGDARYSQTLKQDQKGDTSDQKKSMLTAQRSRLEFSLEILFIRSLNSASSAEPWRASRRVLIAGNGSSRSASKLNSSCKL
jgi:hypothetical protein